MLPLPPLGLHVVRATAFSTTGEKRRYSDSEQCDAGWFGNRVNLNIIDKSSVILRASTEETQYVLTCTKCDGITLICGKFGTGCWRKANSVLPSTITSTVFPP